MNRPEDGAREAAGQRQGRPGPGQSGSHSAAAREEADQNEQDAEAAAGQHQRPAGPDTEGTVSSAAAQSLRLKTVGRKPASTLSVMLFFFFFKDAGPQEGTNRREFLLLLQQMQQMTQDDGDRWPNEHMNLR